jgi:hypothetical protein
VIAVSAFGSAQMVQVVRKIRGLVRESRANHDELACGLWSGSQASTASFGAAAAN